MTAPAHPLARTCAIAVIAKAPRPGHVKTRLQTLLSPDEAAALGTAFLRDTLANVAAAAAHTGAHTPIHLVVAYAPAGQEARFDGMLPQAATLLLADGTEGEAPGVEGFGRVLLHTTRALFAQGYGAVCVLAADSPTLPIAHLVQAATSLLSDAAEAVLGRAEDGGYYILGLTAVHEAPYARIRWSTASAGQDTADRLAEAGLRTTHLPPWYDIDDPASLRRLVSELDAHLPTATHTPTHTATAATAIGLRTRLARHSPA